MKTLTNLAVSCCLCKRNAQKFALNLQDSCRLSNQMCCSIRPEPVVETSHHRLPAFCNGWPAFWAHSDRLKVMIVNDDTSLHVSMLPLFNECIHFIDGQKILSRRASMSHASHLEMGVTPSIYTRMMMSRFLTLYSKLDQVCHGSNKY
jgi:hypothetical protein